MSNFTPLVTKNYEFGGDAVEVVFARYRRKDMLALLPLIRRLSKAKARDDDSDDVSTITTDIINMTLGLLPTYVKSVKGLFTATGEAVEAETIADEMYFIDLATDIATDILTESMVLQGTNPNV